MTSKKVYWCYTGWYDHNNKHHWLGGEIFDSKDKAEDWKRCKTKELKDEEAAGYEFPHGHHKYFDYHEFER